MKRLLNVLFALLLVCFLVAISPPSPVNSALVSNNTPFEVVKVSANYTQGVVDRTTEYDKITATTEIHIHISAYIDGRSKLILRANTVQWHHLDYAAPGRHESVNLPTIINGVEWYPMWPDVPERKIEIVAATRQHMRT